MEAEYNEPNMANEEGLPIHQFIKFLGQVFGLHEKFSTNFKTTFWEDNFEQLQQK